MRFKQAGFLTKIVVLALLIYMVTALMDLRGQIQTTQSQRDALAQQVADQRLENQELADAIEKILRDEAAAKLAADTSPVSVDDPADLDDDLALLDA